MSEPEQVGELGMARNFGSSEAGGFNEITKKYKADPSIENYVRLRRGDPEAEIEVRTVNSPVNVESSRDWKAALT